MVAYTPIVGTNQKNMCAWVCMCLKIWLDGLAKPTKPWNTQKWYWSEVVSCPLYRSDKY